MLNQSNKIRNIINLGGSLAMTIPKETGFKIGDCVIVEGIDENNFKVTKVEWNKVSIVKNLKEIIFDEE